MPDDQPSARIAGALGVEARISDEYYFRASDGYAGERFFRADDAGKLDGHDFLDIECRDVLHDVVICVLVIDGRVPVTGESLGARGPERNLAAAKALARLGALQKAALLLLQGDLRRG